MGIHSLTYVSGSTTMCSSAGSIYPVKVLVSSGLVHME